MAQVTIGSASYPAFETVADADVFLAGDVLRAAAWALRNADAKARGLVSATRLLLSVSWCGDTPAIDAAPAAVKEATAKLASDLLAKPKLFANAGTNSNVKIAKAGSAQVEFFAQATGGPPVPLDIWDGLTAAGLVGCDTAPATSANDAPYVSGINPSQEGEPWCYGRYYGDDGRQGGW